MFFTLNAKMDYVIYGASFVGKAIFHTLSENHLHVRYFIDMQFDKFPVVEGLPVIPLEQAAAEDVHKDNTVVIISVTNRNEHIWIAQYLLESGYCNILYYDSLCIDAVGNRIYEALIANQIDTAEIPCATGLENRTNEYASINGDDVVACVPVELLFQSDSNGNRSIFEPSALLTCFRFFEGRNLATIQQSDAREYEEARTLHFNYSHALNLNKYPSHEQMPLIRWEQNHFIIESGLAWILFLFAKNILRIRCRMSISDYEIWFNSSMATPIWDIITENHISFLYTPIPHPVFFDYPAKRECAGYTRLMEISDFLYTKGVDVRGKNILDIGTYVGYFAQHFNRAGAHVTAVEYDKVNYDLAKSINSLLCCDSIELIHSGIEQVRTEQRYDVSIMLTVLYWHLHTKRANEIMETVDKITSKYLLWESGDEIEYERDWILTHSSFTRYERICSTFGTGKIRELGCFIK